MNKKTSTIVFIIAIALLVGGWYLLTNNQSMETDEIASGPQNATYIIDTEAVALVDGMAEMEAAPESETKIITKYFGNELRADLNDDGREDAVFVLTQETGGSGAFFYVVAAINAEDGWQGSQAVFLGDRIVPQAIEVSTNPSHQNVIVVSYLDRMPEAAMSEEPSVAKSIWLKFDPETMQFGEVAQDFEGEADPSIMTLDMKAWTWVKTTYNNDTELVPSSTDAFTLSFKNDGTFSATTDCNNMGGSYEINENQIMFGEDIVMTRMFCEGSQEQEFASLLGQIQSFFFTSKGELVFDLKFDSGSAMFR